MHRFDAFCYAQLMTRPITLRLDGSDDERLRTEATRLGVKPGTLARMYVRAGLATSGPEERQTAADALARLASLRTMVSNVDAVDVVSTGRAELNRRSSR
jgi:hypothetical protein